MRISDWSSEVCCSDLVMENLSHTRQVTRTFDLKGSSRARYVEMHEKLADDEKFDRGNVHEDEDDDDAEIGGEAGEAMADEVRPGEEKPQAERPRTWQPIRNQRKETRRQGKGGGRQGELRVRTEQ